MTSDIKNDKQNDRVKKLSVIRRFLAQVNILCIFFYFQLNLFHFSNITICLNLTNRLKSRDAKFLLPTMLFQFAATTVENMLLFDMGLCHAFPFIIIAALTSHSNIHNRQEKLSLTDVQASYMASVGYIAEPLGSVLSAFFTGKL